MLTAMSIRLYHQGLRESKHSCVGLDIFSPRRLASYLLLNTIGNLVQSSDGNEKAASGHWRLSAAFGFGSRSFLSRVFGRARSLEKGG